MRTGQQTAQTPSANCRFIYAGVDAALVHTGCKHSKHLANRAEAAHQTVPEIAIHPVGKARARPRKSDDRPRIQFLDPHFVCEEPKQPRLGVLEWINFSGSISTARARLSIKQDAHRGSTSYQEERNEKHGLD